MQGSMQQQDLWAWFNEQVLSFQWFVRLVRYLVVSGGVMADGMFLLATLYVTACVMAHPLLTWIFWYQPNIIPVLNQIAVLVFSWIPELIVGSAITISIDHWKTAFLSKNKWSFVWAIAYSVPTMIFLVMTIVTILSFVSIQELDAGNYKVDGLNLSMRVLFGWLYSVIGMLYASFGKAGQADLIRSIQQLNEQLNEQLSSLKGEMDSVKTAHKAEIESIKLLAQTSSEAVVSQWTKYTQNKLSVTFDDAKTYLGLSKKEIEQGIVSGKIRKPTRGTGLLTVKSLNEYIRDKERGH